MPEMFGEEKKMNNKSPAFQFYPADWLSDLNVATMTEQEEGIYIRLLCYCWNHGSLPANIDKITRLLKNGANHNATTLEPVLKCFVLNEDGDYINPRLEKERKKQEEHREKSSRGGKISAEIRQNKQELKGGSLLVEDGLTPKSNSSSSSSSSTSNNKPNILSEKEKEWETLKQESFEKRWLGYPGKKDGKKASNGHWNASIKKKEDIENYDLAIENYRKSVRNERNNGFKGLQWKNGSTWFNNWQDYIPAEQVPEVPTQPPEPPKPRVPGDPKLEKMWTDCMGMVKSQVSAETYLSFESAFPRSLESGILIIAVPNQVTRKMMIENYREMIELFLKEIAGKQLLVDFCIDRN